MRAFIYRVAIIAAAGLMIAGDATEVGSVWRLRVLDLHQNIKVEGIIRLSEHVDTEFCIRGIYDVPGPLYRLADRKV